MFEKLAYGQRLYVSGAFLFLFLIAPGLAAAKTLKVTAEEYGDKWSFIVPKGRLQCKINAVVMHVGDKTYSLNGKAMSRYRGEFPTWRRIAKPYPGMNDPQAKMPPANDLIKRGLALCK